MRQVILCGGRDYQLTGKDYLLLDWLHNQYTFSEVVHGAQTGADSCADDWATRRGIARKPFPVTREAWRLKGPAAGPIRNAAMAAYVRDDALVLAFPGGRNTRNMVRQAQYRGLEVQYAETERTKPRPGTLPVELIRTEAHKGQMILPAKRTGKHADVPLRELPEGTTDLWGDR